jgi:para-aminobenzoate synthetase
VRDLSDDFSAIAARHARCFWLDGAASRPWSGSRSIVGWLDEEDVSLTYCATTREVSRHAGDASYVVGDDVFAVLEAELAAGPPDAIWVGYFGYASRPDLPARPAGDGMPDAVWMRARTRNLQVVDHAATELMASGSDRKCALEGQVVRSRGTTSAHSGVVPMEYAAAFARVQEELRAGNSYEVNLTHRTGIEADLDPVSAYLRLRELNPAPYAGLLQHHGTWLLSSSPERYAAIGPDRIIETRPIKGTTPRGATPDLDEVSRRLLATDPKFRAENLMIVDLLRNDVGMVCQAGSIEVPQLMHVESYPSVHQLVSTVRGRLRDDISTVAALRALFPAGSMTGAPKRRTMEIIDAVESTPRSVYSGAFGWISPDGSADLAVVIRTLTTAGAGHWNLGTGGGIIVRSHLAEEYAETAWKAERLIAALRVPAYTT